MSRGKRYAIARFRALRASLAGCPTGEEDALAAAQAVRYIAREVARALLHEVQDERSARA